MQFGISLQLFKILTFSDDFFVLFSEDSGYKPSLATFTGGASQDIIV